MGKRQRNRDHRGGGPGRRNSTSSPGLETRDGAREHGPLLAVYSQISPVSGMVVWQVGTREFRRTIVLSADDAPSLADAMREAVPLALQQRPQLPSAGFPDPHDQAKDENGEIDEDVFYARINAWAQDLAWIEPDAEIGQTAGIGVAHAHVVFAQPMLGEPGRYSVTFFLPEDAPGLADQLDDAGREALAMTKLMNLADFGNALSPQNHEIAEFARTAPWPPSVD
jgi:hypothetical protein